MIRSGRDVLTTRRHVASVKAMVKLSWPRDGDAKRAMISRDTMNTLQSKAKRFLNSSSRDTLLSEELGNRRISGENHLTHWQAA